MFFRERWTIQWDLVAFDGLHGALAGGSPEISPLHYRLAVAMGFRHVAEEILR